MSISRSNIQSSFLHIMCHGIGDEYILKTDEEKSIYSSIMKAHLEHHKIIMMANSIMSNHVHMVLFTRKIEELSSFMRGVNHDYAVYYNQKYGTFGHVFNGRYKVQEIKKVKQLAACISYVHQNPVEAGMCEKPSDYKYSSYNDYLYRIGIVQNEKLITLLHDIRLTFNNILNYTEYEENFIEPKKDVERIIKRFLLKNKLNHDGLIKNKKLLKQLLIKLQLKCDMSQVELADRFGLSKYQVQRLLSERGK